MKRHDKPVIFKYLSMIHYTSFAPVTLNTSTNEENLKIALLSYDDLEKDSPFSEMQYRLSTGDYIKHEKKGAVINANLANQNELSERTGRAVLRFLKAVYGGRTAA